MKESFDHMYQHARSAFAVRYDAGEASAMAFALLEDLYGAGRTDVLLGKDRDFSGEEQQEFLEIVKKIATGTPMQYAVGRALFGGRYFKVSPDTLIPRPETEGIVQHLTTPLGVQPSDASCREEHGVRILDCGTGTGCIAITLALSHPDWQVEAWDISAGALAVARENAAILGASNVTFHRKDILAEAELSTAASPLSTPASPLSTFHYIVSNPPYICNKEAADMEAHVLDHEPHSALFVPDDDPLLFYRALAAIGGARLVPGGLLLVECNRAYTQETAALFADCGFQDIEIIDDCFGAPRFVRARRATDAGLPT